MNRRDFIVRAGGLAVVGGVFAGSLPALAQTGLPGPLVSADWLRGALGAADLVVLDYRGRSPDDPFAAGHIPGAVWTEYGGGWRGIGDIPGAVPDAAALARQIGAHGITPDSRVIVVPGGDSAVDFGGAARIYWSLKYAGHEAVAILDGGWAGWQADPANPVATGVPVPVAAGDYPVQIDPSILATTQHVVDSLESDTVLIDSRSADSYRGERKSLASRRAGHIPGAENVDSAQFFDPARNGLLPVADLQASMPAVLGDLGAEVVTYCEAGHVSATNWFVLHELLGYERVALYVDSMPGWTADDARPVAQ